MIDEHYKTTENKSPDIVDYYKSLGDTPHAKTRFLRSVVRECKKKGLTTHERTVRCWAIGAGSTKNEIRLSVLSVLSGIPVANLFKTV